MKTGFISVSFAELTLCLWIPGRSKLPYSLVPTLRTAAPTSQPAGGNLTGQGLFYCCPGEESQVVETCCRGPAPTSEQWLFLVKGGWL